MKIKSKVRAGRVCGPRTTIPIEDQIPTVDQLP